jgi:hypothetical protein
MPENLAIPAPHHREARRLLHLTLAVLVAVTLLLGVLHWFFGDLKVGGVYWFNLDKERNLSTWFTGALFFLIGCAGVTAYYWERRRDSEGQVTFRAPFLWLGVSVLGLAMSLDEVTILHENLFWREVRWATGELGATWHYLTQWQILFAPVIALALVYLVLFFSQRLAGSTASRRWFFGGLACWLGALVLEALRETFKHQGSSWYELAMVVEELLEMLGALGLLAAIVTYVLDLALAFEPEGDGISAIGERLVTRKALTALAVTLTVALVATSAIFFFARRLATQETPVPRLMRAALESRPRSLGGEPVYPALAEREAVDAVWFEDLAHARPLAADQMTAAVTAVQAALFDSEPVETPVDAAGLEDSHPRMVFLSLSDGSARARVIRGSGAGLSAALDQVLRRAQPLLAKGPPLRWVKFDFVEEIAPPLTQNLRGRVTLERGVDGLAFDRDSGLAFLPEEVLTSTLVSSEGNLQPEKLADYLETVDSPLRDAWGRLLAAGAAKIWLFRTSGFFVDAEQILPLYRGHRQSVPTPPGELLAAANRAGDYLQRAVGADGRFVYSYLPKTDREKDSYNILRHAGTVYSMLELYEVNRRPELLAAARRALGYLLNQIEDCEVDGKTLPCIVEEGEVKLGGNALAAIALAKHIEVTGDTGHLPTLRRLGEWILDVQEPDGEFGVHKQSHPDGKVSDFVSEYYPGEALLALMRISALDADARWLDGAEQGARFLIETRDAGVPDTELNHDHWLLYALNEIYRERDRPIFLEHALRIAGAIASSQNRDPEFRDWLGSYYRPPRSTPTATRTEGLTAAYRLARDFDHPAEAARFLEAIRLGIDFQLQTQFRPESVLYLADPQRALGGFHRSLTNYEIRIDYVQHNISGLLAYRQILEELGT